MSSVVPIESVIASRAPNVGVGADVPGTMAQQAFQDALHRPVAEVQIAPDNSVNQLGGKVMERIETFYDRVQRYSVPELGAGEKAAAAPGSERAGDGGAAQPAPKHAATEIEHAMQMMQRAYSFAIETTLVSKVVTESTRTFNNFMRGQ